MPLYEYQCTQCGERREVLQKFSDPPLSLCAKCGGDMKKLQSSPAIQFKGSGFYKTDYPSSTSKGDGASKGESGGKAESGAKGESGAKSEPASGGESSSKGASSSGSESSSKGDASPKRESSSPPAATETRSDRKSSD